LKLIFALFLSVENYSLYFIINLHLKAYDINSHAYKNKLDDFMIYLQFFEKKNINKYFLK